MWRQGRQWMLLLWEKLLVAEQGRQVGAEGQDISVVVLSGWLTDITSLDHGRWVQV